MATLIKPINAIKSYDNTAIAFDGDRVVVYTPPRYGYDAVPVRMTDGRVLRLSGDDGWWWNREKEQTEYLSFAQFWLGEFPWSSFCWALRYHKDSKTFNIQEIETEINPRGLTESDRWLQDCRSYIPS